MGSYIPPLDAETLLSGIQSGIELLALATAISLDGDVEINVEQM